MSMLACDVGMWRGRVSLKVIRAEGLPKPDAIVVVSNGGLHLAQVPSQPDGPESMKKATKVSKGTEPIWEELFIFPATMTLQDEGSNDVLTRTLTRTRECQDRVFSCHVKHLSEGKKWTGNNEGEWLGKVTLRLAEVVGSGIAGLTTALPIMCKNERVGHLHIWAAASQCSPKVFADDVRRLAGGQSTDRCASMPSFSPLSADLRNPTESWPCWRCMVSHTSHTAQTSKAASSQQPSLDAVFALVHVGPEQVVIHFCACAVSTEGTFRRTSPHEETVRRLRTEEILGAKVEMEQRDAEIALLLAGVDDEAAPKLRFSVRLFVLTVPSEACTENGKSSLEVYHLSAFQDAAHAPLKHDKHNSAAQLCCDALAQVSRVTAGEKRVFVVVNPMSGNKKGRALWEQVEVLLRYGDVGFDVHMTSYAGHAGDLVLGCPAKGIQELNIQGCSGVLVIGGDGTVLEILNALILREPNSGSPSALRSIGVGTIPAGSECAFAKMTTFVDAYSAAWVFLKGHKVSFIDVLQVRQGESVTHALCGVGWGLGGKLAEESETLRHAFGPARYLVSGIKGFVKLRGCSATLELLLPRSQSALVSSVCCESLAPLRHPANQLAAEIDCAEIDAEWKVVEAADGLVDVVAVEKTEKMDHFELLKASYHYYRAADKGAARSSGSAVDGQHSPCSSPSSIEKQQCFLIQKALAVRLSPKDPSDKFNVDGEVFEGRPIEVRVLPRMFKCLVASLPAYVTVQSAPRQKLDATLNAAEKSLGSAQVKIQKTLASAQQVARQTIEAAQPFLNLLSRPKRKEGE